MNQFMLYNGKLRPDTDTIAAAGNRGLRYGDGLFETIKIVNGQMPLFHLHADRLKHGLTTLDMSLPATYTHEQLKSDIHILCEKNQVSQAARVRVMIFRGNGTLYAVEAAPMNIVIQAEALSQDYLVLNEQGWRVDICPGIQKSCDLLANLKSNNYLPYIMAALHAKRNNLNDSLVLNVHDRICDATIANVFWVRNKRVYTTPLSEGGVAGVMRRHLLEHGEERVCTEDELLEADEVFLTNALFGIRWVGQFRNKAYKSEVSRELYHHL
jgi:branched-chain amino acid aminotransferase